MIESHLIAVRLELSIGTALACCAVERAGGPASPPWTPCNKCGYCLVARELQALLRDLVEGSDITTATLEASLGYNL
jgi:hypothetical protein